MIVPIINTPEGPISPLRLKRLLILARTPKAWHKRFYHQYYYLIYAGIVGWELGTAYLTEYGHNLLKEMLEEKQ